MKHSMFGIASVLVTLAFAVPAVAQQETSDAAQPQVVQGNTTIVFAPADTGNLDNRSLRTWGDFAEGHPGIAKALAYNPSLMNNSGYLSKHPALDSFFRAHPDIKEAMAENPGNYVAIPPRPGE